MNLRSIKTLIIINIIFSGQLFAQTPCEFKVLKSFSRSTGTNPMSNLLLASDGKIYGTTTLFGISGGTFFSYDPITDSLDPIVKFKNGYEPFRPTGSIAETKTGVFYGTSPYTWGESGKGTFYMIDLIQRKDSVIYNFQENDGFGKMPQGGCIKASDGNIYGTTDKGAMTGGCIFQYNPISKTFKNVHTINYNYIKHAIMPLIELNGKLYSVSSYGGEYNGGTIFSYNLNTFKTEIEYSFSDTITGTNPLIGLVLASDGNLYGTTSLSEYYETQYGTIYRFNPNTKKLDVVFYFPPSSYYYTSALIEGPNKKLYGINGNSVYQFNYENKKFELIKEISNYGYGPIPTSGSLVIYTNDKIYGTTYLGGQNNYGTLFELTLGKDTLADIEISFDPENVSFRKVKVSGNVSNDGGQAVTSRGFCWSTNENPTISDHVLTLGNGEGLFSDTIKSLFPNTRYYVRGFAINSIGAGYSNQIEVITKPPALPEVVINKCDSSQHTIYCQAEIISEGGSQITQSGFCISTSPHPTIQSRTITSPIDTNLFFAEFDKLNHYTEYYIRAFAQNDLGISYSQDTLIRTLPLEPVITSLDINKFSVTDSLLVNEDQTISCGFCYGTFPNPTIENDTVLCPVNNGFISAEITNLLPSTVYYVRSFFKVQESKKSGEKIVYGMCTQTQTLSPDELWIPDANFKKYLINNTDINTNKDDKITIQEATSYNGTINVEYLDIENMTGIQAFINLTELNASRNPISQINVSKNIALTYLNISENKLTSIDVSENIKLEQLDVSYNDLTSVDISENIKLENLEVRGNTLTTIDVSKNTALTYLNVSLNNLTNIDISKNTKLTELDIFHNNLTNIDVSKNTKLEFLWISSNNLTSIDISENIKLLEINISHNSLTNIDVSKNTELTYLDISKNNLTSIDVSKNTELIYLDVPENKLTSIDISENIKLEQLNVSYNNLTSIDVSNLKELYWMDCSHAQLTSVNISNQENFDMLFCEYNDLTELIIGNNNNNMWRLSCKNNPNLDCIQIGSLFKIPRILEKGPNTKFKENCNY